MQNIFHRLVSQKVDGMGLEIWLEFLGDNEKGINELLQIGILGLHIP